MPLSSRKAAMTAHPDKGGSEAKMAAVNEAYEVLADSGTFTVTFTFAFPMRSLILSIYSSIHPTHSLHSRIPSPT